MDPYLHRLAIYEGFASENVSKLIEDMLMVQLQALDKPDVAEQTISDLIGKTR